MTVHAHPDDEASKGPGTIALYSSRGVSTVLVCCTGGEEGDLQNPALAEAGGPLHGLKGSALSQAIAEMRPAELAASAQAIGFDHVVMLGYRDSGMAGCDANTHPDCFAAAPHDDACRRLVTEIRRHRPDVLLTYPDDQRGYPHPDHLRVHEISMAAVEHAADPAWYPDTGPAHDVRKVYYSAWSRRRLLALHDALLKKWGESPFDERWWERPDTDHRITTRIDVADHMRLAVPLSAPMRHRSTLRRRSGLASTTMNSARSTHLRTGFLRGRVAMRVPRRRTIFSLALTMFVVMRMVSISVPRERRHHECALAGVLRRP